MKSLKYILTFLVAAVSLTACQQGEDWTPGEPDSNMGVYFPQVDTFNVSAEDTSVSVPVMRAKFDTEAEISFRMDDLTVEDDAESLFSIEKRVVEFAATTDPENPQNLSSIKINFDGSQLEVAKEYKILLQLDEAEASRYGLSSVTIKIMIPEPWKSLGKGVYRDDFLGPMYGGPSGVMVEVEVVQHEIETNRYRLVEPYSKALCPYIIGGVPEDMIYTGPGYVEFVVAEDGSVTIPSSPLGFQLNVGTGQPEDMFLASLQPGVFVDGVFWFTTPNSIMWHIPDGRGNYANQAGLFAVALPGSQISDYSISAAYAGMEIGKDNTSSSAIINFAVGDDVTSYSFTILEGNLNEQEEGAIESAITAIVEDSEEITIYKSEVDNLTWKLDLPASGIYTLVAVPYGKNGAEEGDAIAYPFYYHRDGGDLPETQFGIYYDSLATLTGNADFEAEYPESFYVSLAIVGNGYEMRSIKAWYGDANVIAETGLTPQEIVLNYGEDLTDFIETIIANTAEGSTNGSVVLNPFNMPTGSTSCAIVAIETIYGDTKIYYVEKQLPNASGFTLGKYTLSDTLVSNDQSTPYELDINITGGYKTGELIAQFDTFQFLGKVNAQSGKVVFDGFEVNDQRDYITNQMALYYDAEKTMAFGYWVGKDADFLNTADLTFSYSDGMLTKLDTFFASMVYTLADNKFLRYEFYFSPQATLTYVAPDNSGDDSQDPSEEPEQPEQPQEPETSAVKCGVSNFKLDAKYNVIATSIKAEVYNGPVNRKFVSNAVLAL